MNFKEFITLKESDNAQVSQFIKLIDNFEQQYYNSVNQLADKIKKELIIPFCNKYRMNFETGMGAYTFQTIDKKITYYSNDDLKVDNEQMPDDTKEYDNEYMKIQDFANSSEFQNIWKILDTSLLDKQPMGASLNSYNFKGN